MEQIIVFVQTDLPEPVEPAIKRWGILDKSASCGLPIISLPKATTILASLIALDSWARTSLNLTALILGLGISTPMVLLPGIGAWILTSFAASAKAISLLIPTILDTFVPLGTFTSYCVTAGPIWISTTWPLIWKSLSTLSKFSLLLRIKLFDAAFFLGGVTSSKSDRGGSV